MSGFQSPQLLTDIYRDMRDRRLLPLVLVLVVGLVIVPIALSSSPKSAAPPTAAPAAPVAKKSTTPSVNVVTSDPGLRDYRRRLRGDVPKDPFVQEFTAPTGLAGAQLTQTSGGTSSTAGTSTAATGTVSPTSTSGTTSTSGSHPSDTSNGSVPSTRTSSGSETKVVFYRVKVRTGALDSELKVQDEVGPLGTLPGGSVTALAFGGVTMDSDLNPKRAFFLVSNSATVVGGDSVCVVGSPCQILSLKLGDYVDLAWTDGLTYRVKLLKFERHVRDKLPAQLGDQSGSSSDQTGSPDAAGSGAG
jgi:hypothetical protein